MFYLRALILGCCQNYKQAIHEVSVAISLNEDEFAYYLLRSKCYQIEGEGNKAFADLQTYINLNPDDTDIHKYAGHLLFENGAFEDALQAYDNGTIQPVPENIDVFLTRSKTHFLLGNIDECIKDMETALSFRKTDKGINFDISVLKLLRVFLNNVSYFVYSIRKVGQNFQPQNKNSLNSVILGKAQNLVEYFEKPK